MIAVTEEDIELALRNRLAGMLKIARDHSRSPKLRVGLMAEQVYQTVGERDDLFEKRKRQAERVQL